MSLYRSFDAPLDAPPVNPDGAVCFTFDDKWRPYILTVLKALLVPENWATEPDRAVGEASLLVEEFLTGGECVTPFAMPAGSIVEYPAAAAPADWLLCDGSAVSRATYAALFAVIGTVYGAGNGTTTFNLPDFRGRAPIGAGQGTGLTNRALAETPGAETHVLTAAELAAHTHTGPSHTHTGPSHTHTGPDHTHTGPSHTHTGPDHTHTGPSHTHNIDHTHTTASRNAPAGGQNRPVTSTNANSDITQTSSAASTSNSGAGGTGATGSGGTGATGASGTAATGSGGTGDTSAAGTGNTGAAGTGATDSAGTDTAHENMQPSLAVNFIIKT